MSANKAGSGNCGCGCSGGGCGGSCTCESRCCELECLVRPNYFCGQLLNDTDLAAMVDWTRQRFALSRYRDGWGVVCGLNLTCSAPDESGCCTAGSGKNTGGPFVYLTPGYAVDCCGNDLVVCEPMKIDLGPKCRPPDDPCNPNALPPVVPAPAPPQPAGAVGLVPDANNPCFEVDRNSLVAVKVSLRYHEDLAQGQRAMFKAGGACGDTDACEFTRVLERPCIHLETVDLPDTDADDDDFDEDKEWVRKFSAAMSRQIRAIAQLGSQGPDAWLDYLRQNPPYQQCDVREIVCCLRDRGLQEFDTATAFQLYGMVLKDWAKRQIDCACFSCAPDTGVPLGVVIMQRKTGNGRTTCKLREIDARKRYRRWLRQQTCQRLFMAESGLFEYIGQPVESSAQKLRSQGVELREPAGKEVASVADFGKLADKLTLSINPLERRELRAHVMVDPNGVRRIIGFE